MTRATAARQRPGTGHPNVVGGCAPSSKLEIQSVRQSTARRRDAVGGQRLVQRARLHPRVETGTALGAVAGDAIAHLVVRRLRGRVGGQRCPISARTSAKRSCRTAPAADRIRRGFMPVRAEPRQVGDHDHDRDAGAADQALVFVAEEQPVLDGAVLGADDHEIVVPALDLFRDRAGTRIERQVQDVGLDVGGAERDGDPLQLLVAGRAHLGGDVRAAQIGVGAACGRRSVTRQRQLGRRFRVAERQLHRQARGDAAVDGTRMRR